MRPTFDEPRGRYVDDAGRDADACTRDADLAAADGATLRGLIAGLDRYTLGRIAGPRFPLRLLASAETFVKLEARDRQYAALLAALDVEWAAEREEDEGDDDRGPR